jgi:hypothetical protein
MTALGEQCCERRPSQVRWWRTMLRAWNDTRAGPGAALLLGRTRPDWAACGTKIKRKGEEYRVGRLG